MGGLRLMAKLLEQLTAEHEAVFTAVRDEWIAHGLSCDAVDREATRDGIAKAYRAANLEPPQVTFFIPSPIGGAITRWLVLDLLKNQRVWDGVGDGVRAGVGDGVWDGVGDGVWDGVRDGVGDGVWAGVWAGVGDGVRDGVRDGVGAGVRAGVRAGVGAGVWDGVVWHKELLYGQHEAAWLSFYDTFTRFGVGELSSIVQPLEGMMQVARSAGWWWAHRGFAVVTDRPQTLHVEPWPARGEHGRRMHCADGPAIAYRDGWSLWYWHGTPVPQWVIEDSDLSVQQIMKERNTEIRRCAIERWGWDRFIAAANLTAVDECDDPGNPGKRIGLFDLPAELNPYPERVRVLLCTNGTPERNGTTRRFGLTVPADMPDALTAAGWTYGLTAAQYAGVGRRT